VGNVLPKGGRGHTRLSATVKPAIVGAAARGRGDVEALAEGEAAVERSHPCKKKGRTDENCRGPRVRTLDEAWTTALMSLERPVGTSTSRCFARSADRRWSRVVFIDRRPAPATAGAPANVKAETVSLPAL